MLKKKGIDVGASMKNLSKHKKFAAHTVILVEKYNVIGRKHFVLGFSPYHLLAPSLAWIFQLDSKSSIEATVVQWKDEINGRYVENTVVAVHIG